MEYTERATTIRPLRNGWLVTIEQSDVDGNVSTDSYVFERRSEMFNWLQTSDAV